MALRHYNIPVFLPELACPHRCAYCNQYSIASRREAPDPESVRRDIEAHLGTFRASEREVEVAFFGGNFTGLPTAMQDAYLEVVRPFMENGQVQGIRCSTRPDYITAARLRELKAMGMRHVELGAQSTDDRVLRATGRGHDGKAIREASEMILAQGLELGLQMMTGLPESTEDTDMKTAADIVALGASETRIYPCLVVRGTALEKRYRKGTYKPQTLEEAVRQSARLYRYFSENGVKVLRMGLHPSEELDQGACVAGPYHRNFAEMTLGHCWELRLSEITGEGDKLKVFVRPDQRTHAIGYRAANRERLLERFGQVEFIADESLAPDEMRYETEPASQGKVVIASAAVPTEAKARLEAEGDTLWLKPGGKAYPTIDAHPDIYFCHIGRRQVAFAPNTPKEWVAWLQRRGVRLVRGARPIGPAHPETARYNACVTSEHVVHNTRHCDPSITEACRTKTTIHVEQAYTRCNLIHLTGRAFITSDMGILRTLREKAMEVLYVDPRQIRLEGHAYGFFPGCCGVSGKTLFVNGSTASLKEKDELDRFLARHGFSLKELHDGQPTDVGGILFV